MLLTDNHSGNSFHWNKNYFQLFRQESDSSTVPSNEPEPEAVDNDSDSDDYTTPIDIKPPPPGPVLPPRSCLARTDSQREALRRTISKEIDEVSAQVKKSNTSKMH